MNFLFFSQASHFKVTDQVYFDISKENEPLGRIIIGLFGEVAPKTVENFKHIATEGIDGKTYAGTKIHRIIKRFMIQGKLNYFIFNYFLFLTDLLIEKLT